MLTEVDSKDKWCPLARAIKSEVEVRPVGADDCYGQMVDVAMAAINRPQDSETNCVAGDCLAWHWGDSGHTKGFCTAFDRNNNSTQYTPAEAADQWCPHSRKLVKQVEVRGFCGQDVGVALVAYNRPVDAQTKCLGTSCMAWRKGGNPASHGFCTAFDKNINT